LYEERAALVRRMAAGEAIPPHEFFLGFCRHTPTVCTNGPAGLNAAVKAVGFVPRSSYIQEYTARYLAHIDKTDSDHDRSRGLQLLLETLYASGCADKLDFDLLSSLELTRGRTWRNLQTNRRATLLFYEPPSTSFEARVAVEIHQADSPYHTLIHAQHDVYHAGSREQWASQPAYLFHIDAVSDKSIKPRS
jgi:hypothetical protein